MRKYVLAVRQWVKQVRPGGRSGEHNMTLEEVNEMEKKLIDQGVDPIDINVKEL